MKYLFFIGSAAKEKDGIFKLCQEVKKEIDSEASVKVIYVTHKEKFKKVFMAFVEKLEPVDSVFIYVKQKYAPVFKAVAGISKRPYISVLVLQPSIGILGLAIPEAINSLLLFVCKSFKSSKVVFKYNPEKTKVTFFRSRIKKDIESDLTLKNMLIRNQRNPVS